MILFKYEFLNIIINTFVPANHLSRSSGLETAEKSLYRGAPKLTGPFSMRRYTKYPEGWRSFGSDRKQKTRRSRAPRGMVHARRERPVILDTLVGLRVGRSYRKSQIPLTSLASYQADGARLRYGFLYGPLGIYFFFTCDGYIFAIGAAAGSHSRAKRDENRELQVSLASKRFASMG